MHANFTTTVTLRFGGIKPPHKTCLHNFDPGQLGSQATIYSYVYSLLCGCRLSVCGATRQLCASACARRRRRSQRYLAPDRWLHLCRSRGLSSSRKLAPIAAISAGRAAVHSGTRSRRRRRLGVAVRPSTGPGGRRAVSVGGQAGGLAASLRL